MLEYCKYLVVLKDGLFLYLLVWKKKRSGQNIGPVAGFIYSQMVCVINVNLMLFESTKIKH